MAGHIGTQVFASGMTVASAAGMGSGFVAGANAGALSGMAAGAFSGAGMTALGGGEFNDIMASATVGTVFGAIGGAIAGGLSEGIRSVRAGGNFRDGTSDYENLLVSLEGAGIDPADNEAWIIERANEKGLIELGNDPFDVIQDVQTYDRNSSVYTKLSKLDNAEQYVSGWKKALNSSMLRRNAKLSPQLGDSPFALKYYPTKGSYTDALGIVWKGARMHRTEAAMELIENFFFKDDFLYDMHFWNSSLYLNHW